MEVDNFVKDFVGYVVSQNIKIDKIIHKIKTLPIFDRYEVDCLIYSLEDIQDKNVTWCYELHDLYSSKQADEMIEVDDE